MESEKPKGASDAARGPTQAANEKQPEAPDVELGAEDPCEAQVKPANEICVLEAQDDVYDETLGTPTNRRRGRRGARSDRGAESTGKTLGRAFEAPSVNELMPPEVRVQPEDQRTAG